MIFIDANVIIKAVTKDKHSKKCRDFLRKEFVTNTLCLVEAHHGISKIAKNEEHATISIKSLFGKGFIRNMDKNLLFDAIRKMKKHNLNIFDSVHYTTALQENCEAIVSYDKHFDNLNIKRIEP